MRGNAALDLGAYRLLFRLASGGMGTVHVARHGGAHGFERLVVVKRIHPHLCDNRDFVEMFLDEARMASQIRHPNVVPVDDVVAANAEIFLVQPYIEALSLAALLALARAADERLPVEVVGRILHDTLAGLDGAHSARDLRGELLEIVHRDVSPHNVLVGTDGTSRLIDFGIARAARRLTVTKTGTLKGKIPYMAPEHLRRGAVDRRADVYAAGVVLYEALTGRRPFRGEDEAETLLSILIGEPEPPSSIVALPPEVDAVVAKALDGAPDNRYPTAATMAEALAHALPIASSREVALVVARLGGSEVTKLRERVRAALDEGPLEPPLDSPPPLSPTVQHGRAAREIEHAEASPLVTPRPMTRSLWWQGPLFRAWHDRWPLGPIVVLSLVMLATLGGLLLVDPRSPPQHTPAFTATAPSAEKTTEVRPTTTLVEPASASASASATATATAKLAPWRTPAPSAPALSGNPLHLHPNPFTKP